MNKEVMLEDHLKARGISNPRVLLAMENTPREEFVTKGYESSAYTDGPLPIGQGQTISQPFIVAFMAESLNLKGDEKVLEIGAGSGYNAVILSKLCRKVISLERIKVLADRAKNVLTNYKNIEVINLDGSEGYDAEAPYDKIILTAYTQKIPEVFFNQLKDGGYLIAPVGSAESQQLILYKKAFGKLIEKKLLSVRFVPLVSDV